MKKYIYAMAIALGALSLTGCMEIPVENHTPKVLNAYAEDINYAGAKLCARVDNYSGHGKFILSMQSDLRDTLRIYDAHETGESVVCADAYNLTSGVTYYFQFVAFDEFRTGIESFTTTPRDAQTLTWGQKKTSVMVGDTIDLSAKLSTGFEVSIWVRKTNNDMLENLTQNGQRKAICLSPGTVTIEATQYGNEDYLPVSEKLEIEVMQYPEIEMEPVDLGLSVKWSNLAYGAQRINSFGSTLGWNGLTDVFNHYLRNGWKAPTRAEINELVSKCKVTETRKFRSVYTEKMFKVTGPNGNSIWITPGEYWSSESSSNGMAYVLYVTQDGRLKSDTESMTRRTYIRPVKN